MKTLRHLLSIGVVFLLGVPASFSAIRAQAPTAIPYDLGEVTIIQERFPEESRFRSMPVVLQGIVAIPEGEGPFPVALLVHGRYGFCTAPLVNDVDPYPCPEADQLRQYEGFAYLLEALAARGYVAIAPDLYAEHNNGFGEPVFGERTTQIIEATLNALASGDGFDADLAGKADLTRLVAAGHSLGTPLAMLYAGDTTYATHRVQALAMVAPAPAVVDEGVLEGVPVALLIAACDGDVGPDGSAFYVSEHLPSLRTPLTVTTTLPGATHNAFSTKLGRDLGQPCAEDVLLAPELQRNFAARFLPDFFDLALRYRAVNPEGE